MRVITGFLAGVALAMALGLMAGSAFAQTTPGSADPCAPVASGTPVGVATPETASAASIDDIDTPGADEAVITAIMIRQQNVVTTLEVILSYSDDKDLLDFARDQLPDASDQLTALAPYVPQGAASQPERALAVLDQLRQEQDLPADQGDLSLYLPGEQLTRLCQPNTNLGNAALEALRLNSAAIVENAAIGELVMDDADASALVAEVAAASEAHLSWVASQQEPEPDGTPAATPAV